MAQVRRTKYVFFWIDDAPFLDIPLLLRGQVALLPLKQMFAISLVQGEEYPITLEELRNLFAVPSDRWISTIDAIEKCGLDLEQLARFERQGLVLTDEENGVLSLLRKRDEQLSSTQWNIYAALYHFMSKWSDVNVNAHFPDDPQEWDQFNRRTDEIFKAFIDRNGKPPTAFHSIENSEGTIELPLIVRNDGLFGLLSKRKTIRALDQETPLPLETFSVILYHVFGCHGWSAVFEDIIAVHKTSPSGGSLHPTEVYPLVINVSGLEPGIYHYNVERHALEVIQILEQGQAREWANEFTAGQSYPRHSQVLFLMTSRFYRNFWKYRKHQKAYAVLLMDAAHLSQTFYLVCASLGLGAFVTAAINSGNIETKLRIDGFSEGAILVCGCGKPAPQNMIDPQFHPFSPKRSIQHGT